MGIKDLWTILTPFCERKPLYELQGKTVAVDLSCWICEAQNVSEYSVQPRMYLRNLYFRTCYLLLMDVIPVFVLEGKAPVLKYQTIADRNAVQFKGAKPKSDKIKTGKDRSRFHFVLKQCEDMLKYMGLACIQGNGEAEAMCAYLNADGMVSGCISQDSDCFAYGAQIVYRNFSISHQGSYAASGGAVDVYDIEKAKEHLNFGRNKIIALALLCGSDYNDGVHGVGKDSTMKFMEKYKDEDILDRMRSWRKNTSLFAELEVKITNKNLCSSCGHYGKVQTHTRKGCTECNTNTGCDFTKFKEERLDIKNELQIRSKALADPDFPNETLINEFLAKKDNVTELDLKWKQPNLINFVKFTNKFLGWEEIYAFEKLLPILTRWQILNYKFVYDKMKRNSISAIKGILFPSYIKKIRNPKGVPSYEIIWEDKQNCFDNLIPEEQLEEYVNNKKDGLITLWSTVEPQNLVDEAYPSLVEEFLEKKNKKGKKASKRPKSKSKNVDELTDQLVNASLSEPKTKRSRGTEAKSVKKSADKTEPDKANIPVNIRPIDTYFTKTKVAQLKQQESEKNLSFDLNASRFGDEDDLSDISDIVEEITSRNPKLPKSVEKLGYHFVFSGKTQSEVQKVKSVNESFFFEMNDEEVDLFEKTFNQDLSTSGSSQGDVEDEIQTYVFSKKNHLLDKYKKESGKNENSFGLHISSKEISKDPSNSCEKHSSGNSDSSFGSNNSYSSEEISKSCLNRGEKQRSEKNEKPFGSDHLLPSEEVSKGLSNKYKKHGLRKGEKSFGSNSLSSEEINEGFLNRGELHRLEKNENPFGLEHLLSSELDSKGLSNKYKKYGLGKDEKSFGSNSLSSEEINEGFVNRGEKQRSEKNESPFRSEHLLSSEEDNKGLSNRYKIHGSGKSEKSFASNSLSSEEISKGFLNRGELHRLEKNDSLFGSDHLLSSEEVSKGRSNRYKIHGSGKSEKSFASNSLSSEEISKGFLNRGELHRLEKNESLFGSDHLLSSEEVSKGRSNKYKKHGSGKSEKSVGSNSLSVKENGEEQRSGKSERFGTNYLYQKSFYKGSPSRDNSSGNKKENKKLKSGISLSCEENNKTKLRHEFSSEKIYQVEKTCSSGVRSDNTEDYEIGDLKENDVDKVNEEVFEERNELNDTFDLNYVPLFERIKKNTRLNTVP